MAAAIAAAMASLYVGLRASSVPFSYDEAYTYLHFVGAPLGTILFGGSHPSANNHTLNSLLMTLSASVFGSSELALRLPNLVAFVAYAGAAWRLARRFSRVVPAVAALVLLLLNPFLLEIFSLARGYGLALAAVLWSLVALAASRERGIPDRILLRRQTQALVLGGLSVFANLAFLNVFLPLAAVVVAARWRRGSRGNGDSPFGALGGPAAVVAVVALYAGPAIWRLRGAHELYYGGMQGFWSDTVGSLVRCSLYLRPYGPALFPFLVAGVAAVLAVAFWIAYGMLRDSEGSNRTTDLLVDLLAVLVLGALACVLEHVLFRTPFPINRTAVWMLPLFLLLAAAEIDVGASSGGRLLRAAAGLLAGGAVVACAAHLALSANTRFAILQYHDADTKQMLTDLASLRRPDGAPGRVSLRASWELIPSIEYYRLTRPLSWLDPATVVPGPANAAFVSAKDLSGADRMRIWKRYETTGNALLLSADRFPETAREDSSAHAAAR